MFENYGNMNIEIDGMDTGTTAEVAKRIAIIEKLVDLKGKAILDCGCGEGGYIRKLREYTDNVIGIEYAQEKVDQAADDVKEFIQQGDIEHLPFEDAQFDYIYFNEVIEHIPNDRAGLAEIWRVLKPGGTLIVFSPNRLFPFETHCVSLKNGKYDFPFYTPFIPYIPLFIGTKVFTYYARNYFAYELRGMLRNQGFKIGEVDYLWPIFENKANYVTGSWYEKISPLFKYVSSWLEKTPFLRAFGVSQMILAHKPE